MSDRHKTPCIYESDAKKRKMSQARDKKHLEAMSKVPVISTYFDLAAIKQPVENASEPSEEASTSKLIIETETPSSEKAEPLDISSSSSAPVYEVDTDFQGEHKHKDVQEHEEDVAIEKVSMKNQGFENDIGLWPESSTEEMIAFWAKKGSSELQHCDEQLLDKASKLQDQVKGKSGIHYSRKCSRSLLQRKTLNNEIINRSWLCFSPTTGKVYCFPCKLVNSGSEKGKLATDGFCDWKRGNDRIADHEKSKCHLESIITVAKLGKEHGRIDQELSIKNYQSK
ncbi:uncharacterized protein [Macrobrachium rosenbergii]|uniref:uncharacterized protein n=1 Tax=Macrobrachium rosenbergii TaxID=79674 RepID=UPI0034D76E72